MFDGIDPLSELRDIHEPAASLWPISPTGWLLAAALIMAGGGLWRWWRTQTRTDPQRAALEELAALRRRQAAGEAAGSLVAELASLLRRLALATHPRTEVAGLCGQQWIDFLAGRCDPRAFADADGGDLAWAPYAPDPDVDVARMLASSETLIVSLAAHGPLRIARAPRIKRTERSNARRLAIARWQIRSACLRDDAPAARRAFLHWAELAWPVAPPRGLSALAARLHDTSVSRALAELDRSLYAQVAGPWRGRDLWRRSRAALKPARNGPATANGLAPLYTSS